MTETVTHLYDEFENDGLVIMTKRESVAENFSKQVTDSGQELWRTLPDEWFDFWLNPDSTLVQLIDAIFGEGEWHLSSMFATRKLNNHSWHRCYPYECRTDPDQPIQSIRVIIALDVFTKYNGSPELLLKSHKEKRWPGSGDFAQCTGPAGSIFICHGATWMRAGTQFNKEPCNTLIIDIVRTTVPVIAPADQMDWEQSNSDSN